MHSENLKITDTDRMDWLERQQPDTLIVQDNMVSTTLRGAIDEAIKKERMAAMPNAPHELPPTGDSREPKTL